MDWKLNQSVETEYIPDQLAAYTIISKANKGLVRLDLMDVAGSPVESFIGTANAVRKDVVRALTGANSLMYPNEISTEHASYIGYELAKAESEADYVQG